VSRPPRTPHAQGCITRLTGCLPGSAKSKNASDFVLDAGLPVALMLLVISIQISEPLFQIFINCLVSFLRIIVFLLHVSQNIIDQNFYDDSGVPTSLLA
jgi:hypothetical protein